MAKKLMEAIDETQEKREVQANAASIGTHLESDPQALRNYCCQLLDLLENYGVEIEGEDNDLIAHISNAVDPAHESADITVCPDCGRGKALTAEHAAAGLCPKWWAVTDEMAEADCRKYKRERA